MYKLETTEYHLSLANINKRVRFAVVADLHSKQGVRIQKIIAALAESAPDYILMPGDIFDGRLDGSSPQEKTAGFELMSASSAISPTFFSFGNHENGGISSWNKIKWHRIKYIPKYYAPNELESIRERDVKALDDEYTVVDGIAFGGLSSGLINQGRAPDVSWLDEFCALDCPKVLLCHHPEYYEKYLKGRNIDLVVSGHAHGGQWRIFGRGVFAPGQGIFPKYTSGVHDGRLVVSRGLKSWGKIPRIFNGTEIVLIDVEPACEK